MLTFVIVNYNKHDLTKKCLEALYAHTKDFECVVVDNGSTPANVLALRNGVLRNYPAVKFAQADNKNGYATGVNVGLQMCDERSGVVLLNNDCFLLCDAVSVIEKAFEETDAGIVGALLLYPDGKIQHDGMDLATRVPGAFVHGHKGEPRQSRYCVAVTGALVAISADARKCLGLLSESYYLGCEDSDYCLRAWAAEIPVWFERNLTATHLEGATRGKTVAEKQVVIGADKRQREADGWKTFRAKFTDDFMRMVDGKVKALNLKIGVTDPVPAPAGVKIDIGCGTNPTPGYVACDARRLRGVQHVFDFGTERWPFKDGTVSEIIMQHSIEHISYRRLPFVLGEARRVLAPGGKLIIRTPDLRFIIDHYLAGKITPEFPPDQEFIAQNFGENPNALSPGWWAVLKMFSGQDYPGNEHRFCFDFETLAKVLASQGFPNAKRFTDKPVRSPGEIYCEVLKP